MRKLVFFSLVLILLALPIMTACAKPAPAPAPIPAPAPAPAPTPAPAPIPAPAEKITWIFSTHKGAASNMWGFWPDPFFQPLLEKMTGGQLTLDTKIDLVPSPETIMAVIDGRADIGNQRLPWSSGTFPQFDFASLPFYFENVIELYNTLTDPDMVALLNREFEKVGLVYLADLSAGPENGIWATRPIAKVEDFKGLKIRTSGMLQTNTLKALGASPLTMQIMELADAIGRGTVDAVATSPGFGTGIGLPDVATDMSIWTVTSNFGGALVVNKDMFYALPGDLQKTVRDWGKRITDANAYAQHIHYLTARRGVAAMLNVIVPEKAEIAKARELSKSSIDLWLEQTGTVGEEILAIASRHASGAN